LKLNLTFKTALFEKESWNSKRRTICLDQFPEWFKKLNSTQFDMGAVGTYIFPRLTDEQNKGHYWPMVDIEADKPEDHDDIEKNLSAAVDAFYFLADKGLDAGIQIMLSGRGIRFLWPFKIPHEYAAAWKLLVPEIPHAETVKDNVGMRLFAYRGHQKQNTIPRPDIHTHLLSDRSEFILLSPEEYQARVSGRIKHSDAKQWLQQVMPKRPLPDAWKKVLEEYKQRITFKNCAVNFPARPLNTDFTETIRQAKATLDDTGNAYHELQFNDGVIWKLDRCPECSRKGIAFLTSSGRIKCWSTNCAAGERGPDDSIIGLPPEEWIPGYEAPTPITPDDFDFDDNTIDEAREMVTKAVQSGKDAVVEITAGAGKTETSLRAILPECLDKKIIFTVPTNEKADEVIATLEGLPPELTEGININRIKGRYSKFDRDAGEFLTNCQKFSECKEVSEAGFSPGVLVCPNCFLYKECDYMKQFKAMKRPGLSVMTHAMALFVKTNKLDAVVFDEDPTRTIIKWEPASKSGIEWFKMHSGSDTHPVFQKIFDTIDRIYLELEAVKKDGWIYCGVKPDDTETHQHLELFSAGNFTQEDKDKILSYLAFWQQYSDESYIAYQRRLYNEKINKRALDWLLTAFGEIPGSAVIKIHTDPNKDSFTFHSRKIPEIKPKGRVIILDATAHPKAMDRLFNLNFDHIKASCNLPNTKTVHIRRAAGKGKMSDRKFPYRKLLTHALDELPADTKSLMICTWKSAEEKVRETARTIRPDLKIDCIHYGANRGLNEYENHDAGMLFGTYTGNPTDSDMLSKIIFGSGPEAQQDRDSFRNQASYAENIQAIHRVRPVNGNKTLVIVGREWIPGLPAPQISRDMRPGQQEAQQEALNRAMRFFEKHGFIYRHILWMLGIWSAAEDKQGYARQFYEFCLRNPEVEKVQYFCLINNILLDKSTEAPKVQIIGNRNYYTEIIEEISKKYPNAPELFTTQNNSGKEIRGLGSLFKASLFFNLIGSDNFDPKQWRQVDVESVDIVERPEIPEEYQISELEAYAIPRYN